MLYIVVPAYNEEKNIGRVIRGLFQNEELEAAFGEFGVVVVEDGSTDATADEAAEAGAVVVRHPVNRGQGAAIQTGNEFALENGASVIVHFDADGQMDVHDILPAIQTLKNGKYDVLIGSRFLDNRSKLPWAKRYLILPVGRYINRLFTGLKLTDAHNGFRILTSEAAKKIYITQDGMAHNTEIPALINKYKLHYVEYPVKITYSEFGQGIGSGFKTLRDLLFASIIKH